MQVEFTNTEGFIFTYQMRLLSHDDIVTNVETAFDLQTVDAMVREGNMLVISARTRAKNSNKEAVLFEDKQDGIKFIFPAGSNFQESENRLARPIPIPLEGKDEESRIAMHMYLGNGLGAYPTNNAVISYLPWDSMSVISFLHEIGHIKDTIGAFAREEELQSFLDELYSNGDTPDIELLEIIHTNRFRSKDERNANASALWDFREILRSLDIDKELYKKFTKSALDFIDIQLRIKDLENDRFLTELEKKKVLENPTKGVFRRKPSSSDDSLRQRYAEDISKRIDPFIGV